ncbi:MAG: hypothetical protein HKO58_05805, partial [Gammaproteobacteria bacterium]|nr:hypothetical protein [Gammaproteobacteria bacterium]
MKQKSPNNKIASLTLRITQSGILLGFLLTGYFAYTDYVGTLTNRIFLDPESIPVVSDGYQVGDVISYIAESTPDPGSGSTVGAGAWNTLYIPPGVEVVGTEIVGPDGDGTYSAIAAPQVAPIKNGCGGRGCAFPITGTIQNGRLNENQQDSGIFYSTNPRTQLLSAPLEVQPTGVGNQEAWNLWDAQQVRAYGGQAQLTAGGPVNGAISANGGKGNTPVVDIDLTGPGTVFAGTGSPVAGPETYFTNDYNPVCTDLLDDNVFEDVDLLCQGPWQRIAYMGDTIGGSGPVTPVVIDGVPPNVNTSVATSLGVSVSEFSPLPSNTNAVRYVLGKRIVGQLETVRITFRITDPAAFTNSLMLSSFCYDATGGDTDKDGVNGRGAQDNIWRYYEGNNHFCFSGTVDVNAFKTLATVDGQPSSGTADANSILGYQLKFTNTGTMPLYDINITDTPTTPNDLALIAEGASALCPYANYDGDAGAGNNLPTLASVTPTLATWNELAVLGQGETVTLHVCAQVDNGAKFGDILRNQMSATYATSDGGTPEPALTSVSQIVVSTLISGTVFLDNDSSGSETAGDTGIESVVVELYLDNGTTGGVLDAGDTLLDTNTTNELGQFSFVGQNDGDNYLVVETGLGFLLNSGDKDTTGACAVGNAAATSCDIIAFQLNGSSIDNNFYNVGATIGDFVWTDNNGDGVQDAGEPGVDGVTVDLYEDNGTVPGALDAGDTLLDTQTTAGGGAYDFDALGTGNYIVEVTDTAGVISGYTNTTANNPLVVTIATPGQDFNDADFGYRLQIDLFITKEDSDVNVTTYT